MTQPFTYANLFPWEKAAYDEIEQRAGNGEDGRDVLDELTSTTWAGPEGVQTVELDLYYKTRIASAIGGAEEGRAYREHYVRKELDRRAAPPDDPTVPPQMPRRLQRISDNVQVTELATREGYALVQLNDGTREVWPLHDTQEVGPDPDLSREANAAAERAEQAARHAAEQAESNPQAAAQWQQRAEKHAAEAAELEKRSYDWCRGTEADQQTQQQVEQAHAEAMAASAAAAEAARAEYPDSRRFEDAAAARSAELDKAQQALAALPPGHSDERVAWEMEAEKQRHAVEFLNGRAEAARQAEADSQDSTDRAPEEHGQAVTEADDRYRDVDPLYAYEVEEEKRRAAGDELERQAAEELGDVMERSRQEANAKALAELDDHEYTFQDPGAGGTDDGAAPEYDWNHDANGAIDEDRAESAGDVETNDPAYDQPLPAPAGDEWADHDQAEIQAQRAEAEAEEAAELAEEAGRGWDSPEAAAAAAGDLAARAVQHDEQATKLGPVAGADDAEAAADLRQQAAEQLGESAAVDYSGPSGEHDSAEYDEDGPALTTEEEAALGRDDLVVGGVAYSSDAWQHDGEGGVEPRLSAEDDLARQQEREAVEERNHQNWLASAKEDQEANYEEYDFTIEEEERAAGVPSAQADDYSEEPLEAEQGPPWIEQGQQQHQAAGEFEASHAEHLEQVARPTVAASWDVPVVVVDPPMAATDSGNGGSAYYASRVNGASHGLSDGAVAE